MGTHSQTGYTNQPQVNVPSMDLAPQEYAANSRFSWPLAPGLPALPEANLRFRYTKSPATPEFAAIPWMQVRMRLRTSEVPDETPPRMRERLNKMHLAQERLLLANSDIDNDGKTDTLVKLNSTEGYYAKTSHNPEGLENIYIIRGREIAWKDYWSIEDFYANVPRGTINIVEGDMVRPFQYLGVAYILRYSLGEDAERGKTVGHSDGRETIEILKIRGDSKGAIGQAGPIIEEVICNFDAEHIVH